MKIAVTYDNGEIFQHFGKTESFKVYEVEDNKVVSSEVIGANGTGHGALAGLLAEQGVNVLICGGIGGGAQTHTEQFKLYDIENGKVVASEVVGTNGSGHGALAGFLAEQQVQVLICGGIGGGAQNALAQAGIKLFGGCSGNADQAVEALLEGQLNYDADVKCSHHDHEHGEGGHQCGNHGCGNHGCGSHSCH